MSTVLSEFLSEFAEIRRRLSNMGRFGPVHQYKKGMARVVLGTRPDGKPWLSPWLPIDQANGKGAGQHNQELKKGQNVFVACQAGDFASASIVPFAPNKENKRPKEFDSDRDGDKGRSFMVGELLVRERDDWYDVSLGGDKGAKVRLHKKGGITARVGKHRLAVNEKGAKMKAIAGNLQNWFVVEPDRFVTTNKPTVIGPDPMRDDDD